jgi:hypothetical protein
MNINTDIYQYNISNVYIDRHSFQNDFARIIRSSLWTKLLQFTLELQKMFWNFVFCNYTSKYIPLLSFLFIHSDVNMRLVFIIMAHVNTKKRSQI